MELSSFGETPLQVVNATDTEERAYTRYTYSICMWCLDYISSPYYAHKTVNTFQY